MIINPEYKSPEVSNYADGLMHEVSFEISELAYLVAQGWIATSGRTFPELVEAALVEHFSSNPKLYARLVAESAEGIENRFWKESGKYPVVDVE
jgi:hypothetical protein